MFSNYLKVTLRSLLRAKTYSLINILGLAIGFACFSFISMYIKNERDFESFNPLAHRAYRVIGIFNERGLGEYHNAVTPAPLAPAIAAEIPQIRTAARLLTVGSALVTRGEKRFYENDMEYADPGIVDILSVKLLAGDGETALKAPRSIVIDRTTAEKYFGKEDPLGKDVSVTGANDAGRYTITGVMEDYPRNSHAGFSMLVSFSTIEGRLDYLKRWNTNCLATYVLLQETGSAKVVEEQLPAFVKRHRSDDDGTPPQYYLQLLSDIHLHSRHILYQQNRNQGSANVVELFTAIGVFVLLIAAINYMNLATARSIKRAKEVGLRKVLGAQKKDLFFRFIGESTVTALLAFILSVIFTEIGYSAFMSIMGDRLVSSFHHNAGFLLTMFTICLVVGAASGTYPALILSSYQPAQTVHGSFAHGARGAALRKALVFVQFSIAILLLACTGMVRAQMEYVRTKEVGFDKSQLLYVRLRDPDARSQYLLMREEIVQNVAIRGVSAGGGIAGAGGSDGTMIVAGTNKSERTMMRFSPVDYDFFSTLDIPMVQGRDFSRAIASDSSNGVIVNESTLHELGWKDAIGKQFENGGDDKRLTVIGVVKDYHFFSLYMKIEPQLLYIDRTNINDMLVRIRPGQIEQGVALVERIWKQHLPAEPFEYGFVDQAFDQQYRADQNTQKLFGAFSLVAVIVGCLGLFGLSSFTAEQRTKEIGIRKVLGASAASIAARLSVEFVKLVALSCIVAFPVGYWAMQEWLQNFAYRTTISPLTFILAGGIVVVIALVTVSVQSIKVSLANPIEALRYE